MSKSATILYYVWGQSQEMGPVAVCFSLNFNFPTFLVQFLSGPLYPKLSTCFEGAQLTVRKLDLLNLCFSLNFYFLMFLLQFPSMFPLLTYSQSFFSLSADYLRHSRRRRNKNLIQLIQEQSKISFYNLRISQDSQTDHWIQW